MAFVNCGGPNEESFQGLGLANRRSNLTIDLCEHTFFCVGRPSERERN